MHIPCVHLVHKWSSLRGPTLPWCPRPVCRPAGCPHMPHVYQQRRERRAVLRAASSAPCFCASACTCAKVWGSDSRRAMHVRALCEPPAHSAGASRLLARAHPVRRNALLLLDGSSRLRTRRRRLL
eukprot:scaffold327_cov58-Phaeocystis_antarctica.AAC.6